MATCEHTLIQGCPGNGKTAELANIVREEIECDNRVLCLSFTRGAAIELADRLKTTDSKHSGSCTSAIESEQLVVTTIHAWTMGIMNNVALQPPLALETTIAEGLKFVKADPTAVSSRVMYDVVVTDEAQDLSADQSELLFELITRVWPNARGVIVGDVTQSIYGFQHARPDLMLSFPEKLRDAGCTCTVKVRNTNRRCSTAIIDAANLNLAKLQLGSGCGEMGAWLRRMVPPIEQREHETYKPKVLVCTDAHSAVTAACAVVSRLLIESKLARRPPSIAILHRNRYGIVEAARTLICASIDVELVDGDDGFGVRNGPVQLRTIHSAKGGTWDSVIVLGASESVLPSTRALSRPETVDEERRLFHVALTRARYNVVLLTDVVSGLTRFVTAEDLRGAYDVRCVNADCTPINPCIPFEDLCYHGNEECQVEHEAATTRASREWMASVNNLQEAVRPLQCSQDSSLPHDSVSVARALRQLLRARESATEQVIVNALCTLTDRIQCSMQSCTLENVEHEGLSDCWHHTFDVRALQRQALQVVSALLMCDAQHKPRRVPTNVARTVFLPGMSKAHRAHLSSGQDVVHATATLRRRHELRQVELFGRKRRRDDTIGSRMLAFHGLSHHDYEPYRQPWEFHNGAFAKLRAGVMSAWGRLTTECAPMQCAHDALRGTLMLHDVTAARVLAPTASAGALDLKSLLTKMQPAVETLACAVRMALTTSAPVGNPEKDDAPRVAWGCTETTPDALSMLAIAVLAGRDRVNSDLRVSILACLESPPTVTTVTITTDLQSDAYDLFNRIIQHIA